MASTTKPATLFFRVLFVLAFALLLTTCIAERGFHRFGLGEGVPMQSPLKCNLVHAVQDGETCAGIAQQFSLTTPQFGAINPNLVCNKLFAGQWICIAGGPTN